MASKESEMLCILDFEISLESVSLPNSVGSLSMDEDINPKKFLDPLASGSRRQLQKLFKGAGT